MLRRHCITRVPRFHALAVLLGLLLQPHASAEIIEDYLEEFYVVNAKPDRPLSPQIFSYTRIKHDNRQFGGQMRPQFSSRFHWTRLPDGTCRMKRVVVNLKIRVELPRLFEATDAQRAEFDSYIASLRAHEHGHVWITRATLQEFVSTLEALPPMATCDILHKTAYARGEQILGAGRQRQIDYDRETGHGRTQGAYLR